MGDVYRATDPRLRRDVAVKVLSGTVLADAGQLDRFLQEARVTASLDHPNIVRVHDVGLADDRPYMIAELLDGCSLRARLDEGPLAIEDAVRIAIDLSPETVFGDAAWLPLPRLAALLPPRSSPISPLHNRLCSSTWRVASASPGSWCRRRSSS